MSKRHPDALLAKTMIGIHELQITGLSSLFIRKLIMMVVFPNHPITKFKAGISPSMYSLQDYGK